MFTVITKPKENCGVQIGIIKPSVATDLEWIILVQMYENNRFIDTAEITGKPNEKLSF
jgi:hypothetical protein